MCRSFERGGENGEFGFGAGDFARFGGATTDADHDAGKDRNERDHGEQFQERKGARFQGVSPNMILSRFTSAP
jgi:hypothetical protein